MKVLVTFSGGKDSLASLLWVRKHITKNFTTVFCDTGSLFDDDTATGCMSFYGLCE